MNFNSDGIEIEAATDLEVYGVWLKFTDSEGVAIKISPEILKKLMVFALDNFAEFDEGAWK